MTSFRFVPLALALTTAGALVACNTTPGTPIMTAAPASGMTTSDSMAKMDTQTKMMKGMHDKMMAAKTPEERSKMMAEHMKIMQDGMKMMDGMGDMKGMQGMTADMSSRHQMMEKRMEMMQAMMKMMMDRMPAATTK